MNDIKNGKETVTFVRGSSKTAQECELLTKAIINSMGNFTLYFVQPDGGIGNKTITLCFDSILYVGNNGFILYGTGEISGKKLVRDKWVDDFRKIKVFYNAESKTYSWINTYRINNERNIRVTRNCNIILPKGNGHELLVNKTNEERLFSNINSYVDADNTQLPPNLQLNLKL